MDRDFTKPVVIPALAAFRARRRRAEAAPPSAHLPSPLHWLLRVIMGAYPALMVRRVHWVDGRRLDKGPHVLVSNHGRVTDGFILIARHPGRIHAMIQAESFGLPIIGRVFQHSGQIPIAPGRGMEAIDLARAYLAQGEPVLVYPEGKLNHGGGMLRGKVGAARLAFESRVPIVPVGAYVPERNSRAVHGKFYDRPTLGYWQVGGTCHFAVGDPWWPFEPDQDRVDLHQLRLVTDEIMARIQRLMEKARAAAG